MMFDCLEETEEELIKHVRAACKALDFFRSHDLDEVLESSQLHETWGRHWNALNTARVHIQMSGEYLHEELNYHHDKLIDAQGREIRRRKSKEKSSSNKSAKAVKLG